MTTKLRSWWQQIKQHRLAIGVVVITLVIFVALITIGYLFNWTGFKGKTLWDWLQLLIIPFVLAVGGLWFNQAQTARENKAADKRYKDELGIAHDNQQAATLGAYIDKMSELLLEKRLGELKQEPEEVQKIARVRTLTVLPRLDANRKRSVLHFLYESRLINKNTSIIDLKAADLSEANLYQADQSGTSQWTTDLSGADLHEVNLSRANLSYANLSKVDLRGADLKGAKLHKANLKDADLGPIDDINVSGADLSGADLSGADLSGANLKGTNLKGANLSKANLSCTNLSGADLSGAVMCNVELTTANLTGADLSGANLKGARVTPEPWREAKSLQGAIMPDGSIHP